MLDIFESVVFFGIGPILWASGLWLFLQTTHSSSRKAIWILVLILLGTAIGFILPFTMIRKKIILLLLILPVVAMVDAWLMKSNRGFSFWFRACAFEVCTVFATAAIFRYLLDALKIQALI
ncbi:MAG: hypothetical protein ACE5IR_10615 [bacterium]